MTATPTVGVLALQGDVREHVAALAAEGAHALPVRRLRELAEVDALVLPGGESTTIDKLLRAFGLAGPLRARMRAGLPVYGACAGMILLADHVEGAADDQQTLGGIDATVRRNAFGRQVDSFEEDLDAPAFTAPGEGPLRAVFIRAPWVEATGPDVEVLARTTVSGAGGGGTGKIVAVRHGRLLATAFHPEIGGETRVHRYFVQMVRDAMS